MCDSCDRSQAHTRGRRTVLKGLAAGVGVAVRFVVPPTSRVAVAGVTTTAVAPRFSAGPGWVGILMGWQLLVHGTSFTGPACPLRSTAVTPLVTLMSSATRRTLALAGAVKDRIRAFLRRNWRRAPVSAARRARAWLAEDVEYRIYRLAADEVPPCDEPRLARDRLEDLLAYRSRTRDRTLERFLRSALQRLEQGSHCYTRVENGLLLHHGWLVERQAKSHFTEVDATFEYPPGSAVLYDFYSDPDARGRGLYQAALRQMTADAAASFTE